VDGGTKMIVADTDTMNTSPTAHNLAVIDIAAALAGKPALPGYIPSGNSLGSFVLQTGGQYLFVLGNGSAQIQVVNLSDLP
jgi:hypothetical protein